MKKNIHYAIIAFIAFTTVGFSQVDLGDDITTCEDETVILDATTQDATSYQWSFNGQVIPNWTNATHSVTQAGEYEVTVMVNGNSFSDSILVNFISGPTLGSTSDLILPGINGTNFAIFDLTSRIPQITGGNPDLVVTFFEFPDDAFANINPITNPTAYQNGINPQNITTRVEDINTGCASLGNLVLQVNDIIVNCNTDPGITTFCYGNNDTTKFIVTNESGGPVTVEFLAGQVEVNWDELIIIDSDGVTQLYNGYGNNGDLTGLIFESTGDELTVQVSSDNVVSCATGDDLEPWQFTANCGIDPVGIIGVASFLDENNNGVFDDGETPFSLGNIHYEVNNDGNTNIGSANSNYLILSDDPSNSYDFTFVLYDGYENCYNITTPTINDISVGLNESITIYFPIIEQQSCEDVEVILMNPLTPPRPGFTHRNLLKLNNLSFTAIASGTVEVVIDDQLVLNGITSINPNYTVTNTATGFTVDFVNLEPVSSEIIEIELLCPASVPLDEVVTNTVTYTTDDNDLIVENNNAVLSETVVGSWDPNDIRESHGPEIIHPDFTSEDYLYYTIRFQNLGTAEAINVRIEETLNTQVDETTFQMIAASHDYQVRRTGSELVWNFDDINLPAEMFDADGSNGYVYFKIKPKAGYAIGDIIPALAGIYFDFNAPVITNTFETEFVEPLSVNEQLETQLKIYPNPVSDVLYVELKQSETMTVELLDIHGKQTMSETLEGKQLELDISNLTSGIYFLKLSSNTRQITKKIIVN